MKLYIIMSHTTKGPLRYGANGGGGVSYCLYRGQIVAFQSMIEAQVLISTFAEPDDYEVVEFAH